MPNGDVGGVETAVTELVAALGRLSQSDGGQEQYVIIGPHQGASWLNPFANGHQRVVSGANPTTKKESQFQFLRRAFRPSRPLIHDVRAVTSQLTSRRKSSQLLLGGQRLKVPTDEGFFKELDCDVLHFPYQHFVRCALPTIYNPHDLQHLHYPQFFTEDEIKWRECIYRAGCQHSDTVVVASHWIKQDIVSRYQLHPNKVQVIPWAAPTHGSPKPSPTTLDAVAAKYALRSPFALYPAVTWEHKNHLRLLEAIARLRDRDGLEVRLVCTGHRTHHYQKINDHLRSLDLNEQVQFVGSIPNIELRALYHLAQFVIIPTLFEAASAPLFEAWRDSAPVACAAVTSLPEQAADAALLFDPSSVEAIADALRQMRIFPGLRQDLVERGARRLQDFSWILTAKAYRAVYRRAAGQKLSDEEKQLLSWDWMRESSRKIEVAK